uniref:Uncharacterized protein n=1 Tax=Botryococcus braunii TaxID=38881 RepID=A0A0U2F015_BOTBR|nr:hypothetical protein [Botryococcus braunii]AKU37116.1 hypothetical protein [Botryococcus braunii]
MEHHSALTVSQCYALRKPSGVGITFNLLCWWWSLPCNILGVSGYTDHLPTLRFVKAQHLHFKSGALPFHLLCWWLVEGGGKATANKESLLVKWSGRFAFTKWNMLDRFINQQKGKNC